MQKTLPHLESVLADERWTRDLARSLVRDADRADELVQSAHLAALRRPPQPGAPHRPWLAATMRNLVRSEVRSRANRDATEAGAARPEASVDAPDLALARAEGSKLLIEAVAELDAPYQSAILARYFDEQPPRAIAKRSGVPVKTVRARLHRGLAMLRQRLDREHGREAWVVALVPLTVESGTRSIGRALLGDKARVLAAVSAFAAIVVWWSLTASPTEIAAGPAAVPNERGVALAVAALGPAAETGLGGRESVTTRAPETSTAEVDVLALHARTLEPIAGATIHWWPLRDGADAEDVERWFMQCALEQRLGPPAAVARTDAEGRARVPAAPDGGLVIASTDRLWGKTIGLRHDRELRVGLKRDGDLAARMIDVDGDPVRGCEVALVIDKNNSVDYEDEDGDEMTAVTGLDGIAKFEHARVVLPPCIGIGQAAWVQTMVNVQPRGLVDDVAPVEVACSDFDSAPIDVRVPRLGSAHVDVVHRSGARHVDPVELMLAFDLDVARERAVCYGLAADDFNGAAQRYDTLLQKWVDEQSPALQNFALSPFETSADGTAMFAAVALDRRLLVIARSQHGGRIRVVGCGAGPRASGETARLTAVIDPPRYMLRGRIARADGNATQRQSVGLRLYLDGEFLLLRETRLASRGAFSLGLDVDPRKVDGTKSLVLTATLVDARGAAHSSCTLTIPTPFAASELDLGELMCTELPVAVRGVVVDHDGRPIGGATATGCTKCIADDVATADIDGRFELRCACRLDEIEVVATKPGYLANSRTCSVPALAETFRMLPVGAIVGSVRYDSSIDPSHLWVYVRRTGAESWSGWTTIDDEGRFLFDDLASGTYDVAVHVCGNGGWGASVGSGSVEGVEVLSGEVAWDRRLDPIDVSAMRAVCITTVTLAGDPVPGFEATCCAGDREYRIERSAGPTARIALHDEPATIVVGADGFANEILHAVDGDRRVVLRPQPELRVSLPFAPTIPDDVGVYVSVSPTTVPNCSFEPTSILWSDPTQPLATRIPWRGPMRLRFGAWIGREVWIELLAQPIDFTLPPEGDHELEIPIDQATIDRAIDAARQAALENE